MGRRAAPAGHRAVRPLPAVKVAVLGAGFHGRGIAYQLAGSEVDLTILDRDEERAREVGSKAGVPWETVDVSDPAALRDALAGVDMVVNAVGPYHRSALGVVEAAIECGVQYADMNDDHEVAEALLLDSSWDERARKAGVTVLIDCGVVPGLSGMLVRHAADQLDSTYRVAIRFVWNYSRSYPAAIQHFLRINSGDGPQYIDGRFVRMAPFGGREEIRFLEPVGATPVYFTGVPDPVAIARFVPGVREATAKGAFYQPEANRMMEDMVRWGFTSYDPPTPGVPSPMQYLMGFLESPRGEPFFEIPRLELPLALRVEVEGERSDNRTTLSYEVHDRSRRATTTFTAQAALAAARGELDPGVVAPEAWPNAAAFLHDLVEEPHIRLFHWRDDEPPRRLGPREP
ncbi:MAG TPA: saccharopine dehydrogenase NADP-binding domain-containing protein [Actinomycetota bacterium]|nr:saccharopine dehydrogenase NADP-binding domain-containing protein [Actinomycetota bacterium]